MSKKIEDGLTKNQRYYRTKGKYLNAARQKAYREKHPEYNKAACKKGYAKAIDERRRKARENYQRSRKLRDRTPEGREKERLKKAKRRTLKAGGAATLTLAEWLEICRSYDYSCAYCGCKRPLEQDHVVATTKGGSHTKENVVPACKSCNSSKGNSKTAPKVIPSAVAKNPSTNHNGSRLSESDIIAIRELYPTTSRQEIAAMYGVTPDHITRIGRRQAWAWIP